MIFCRPVVLDCISVALLGSIVAQRLAVSPQSKRVQRFASTVFVFVSPTSKNTCVRLIISLKQREIAAFRGRKPKVDQAESTL